MFRIHRARAALALAAALAGAALPASAKEITLPPSGDNQPCTVIQHVGLATVRVDYSSPDVHGPNGEDRTGKIWGGLVPYGLHDQGFNDCTQCPWRAGANENTVLTLSHDALVEGRPLAAGRYGVFMIAGPEEWTVIFSRNSTSWGSYWYDPKEDALRVTVKPLKSEYREWLTYEFTDRRPDRTTLALAWEHLQVPFTIAFDHMPMLYVENMRRELRDAAGFDAEQWRLAADYCLRHKVNLDEGLRWAQNAVSKPGNGVENFANLSTLARLQEANGRPDDAKRSMERAMALPGTTPVDIHMYGRALQGEGREREALDVFKANAKRFPGQWPVHVGLARGYAGTGDYRTAIVHARKALAQAPDEGNRRNLEVLIKQFEERAAAK